ncbi:magnesium transporter NIPA-domain-containing protein [Lactifluus subvellereus]|nr:magnesium transporter NIPA-domain-containing protein [Lactifluus subvellereus]
MHPTPQQTTMTMTGSRGIADIEFPSVSRTTVIGIAIAIAGNVLISFALNLQKLAHARLERSRAERGSRLEALEEDGDESAGEVLGIGVPYDLGLSPEVEREARVWNPSSYEASPLGPRLETSPLIPLPVTANAELLPSSQTYGALFPSPDDGHVRVFDDSPLRRKRKTKKPSRTRGAGKYVHGQNHHESNNGQQESEYLKSKLWWSGFFLMNVGETGNFISYAFAPASVVAPLGTFALIANCLFAPLLLHERLRKRDLFGIVLAIIGAVTVVLSSNASDTRLSPEQLLQAISQRAFLLFSVIYAVSATILMGLSEGSAGRRWVLVDIGVCALFGGFTVLSTKAISTLLTTRGFDMLKLWMTYPVLLVLVGTGVGQIRYLNRALMRFDSKVVFPTQFVLFNLSAILGSAILYGDFRTAKFHQFVTFVYGCAATFAGVWIIAWEPTSRDLSMDKTIGDVEPGLLVADGVAAVGVGRKPGNVPVLRSRRSTLSLVGISPAQRLLLVHTPPRTEIQLGQELGARETEYSTGGRGREGFEGSIGRRRGISWVNDGSPTRRLGSRVRERGTGSVERRWVTDNS